MTATILETRAEPPLLYISAAPADAVHADDLRKQLAPLVERGLVRTWQYRQVLPGDNRWEQVQRTILQAQIALILLSSDYLDDPVVRECEVPLLQKRAQAGALRIVPVIARPCMWNRDLLFGRLEPLPRGAQAVTTWKDRDEAWSAVAAGLDEMLTTRQVVEAGDEARFTLEEDALGPFAVLRLRDVAQRMRWIPPGTFMVGSLSGHAGASDDEMLHRVQNTRGFWMADTPCTQEFWAAVMGTNPSRFHDARRPVEMVSWFDCKGFVERLNARLSGVTVRLPTEAEWECACRAGTTTEVWAGPVDIRGAYDAPILDKIAWYGGNCGLGFDLEDGVDSSGWIEKQYPHVRAGTRRVAQKRPNPYGLYDMLGNVWEWCEDWYGPYDADDFINPIGPTTGTGRVLRGGSWFNDAMHVRTAVRSAYDPDVRVDYAGFRFLAVRASLPLDFQVERRR